ncbi:hypothetical protein ciss_13450 [Carboxydothermus islandicus]|uniref:Uncharacterized protein n=1 Tax=Carboxydothermus islandicus TaxID=661089 RepID=A0A1L8D2K1_9THEO|nr:hypothetical protein [Carboxydothermus islandicus]GAV25412.1 hypothetical protein ciss_13450 [Carboxydothermus islandicus]
MDLKRVYAFGVLFLLIISLYLGYLLYDCSKLREREITANTGEYFYTDLNGDGQKERVAVKMYKNEGSFDTFTIKAGNTIYNGEGDNLRGNVYLIDLNPDDKVKELLIPEDGPGNDYKALILRMEGTKILPFGVVYGGPEYQVVPGGIKAMVRGKLLHTWFYPVTYELRDGFLKRTEQKWYYMGADVTVIQDIYLYKDRERKDLIKFAAGEKATILITDDEHWCLLEDEKGKTGWLYLDGYDTVQLTGKSAREYLSGLNYAD